VLTKRFSLNSRKAALSPQDLEDLDRYTNLDIDRTKNKVQDQKEVEQNLSLLKIFQKTPCT